MASEMMTPAPSRATVNHALIIEDNMIVSRAIGERLADAGFVSFDYAWTEQQAVDLAQIRFPDLIVVGDDLESGSGVAAAHKISRNGDVAILRTTAKSYYAKQSQPEISSLHTPCRLDQIECVVEAILYSAGPELISC